MNLQAALDINGYMPEHELRAVALWAKGKQSIVEIGTYMGRTARALADNSDATVFAIDDFGGLRERNDNPTPDQIRFAFNRNMSDHLQSGRVKLFIAPHEDIIPFDCDMCFIDGSHDFNSVARDICKWDDAATFLCGHDYDAAHRDVMQAVNELIWRFRVIPGTSLWYRV